MADEIDRANDVAEKFRQMAIDSSKKELDPGKPGQCDICGEESPRLIKKVCAPCRDEFGLE